MPKSLPIHRAGAGLPRLRGGLCVRRRKPDAFDASGDCRIALDHGGHRHVRRNQYPHHGAVGRSQQGRPLHHQTRHCSAHIDQATSSSRRPCRDGGVGPLVHRLWRKTRRRRAEGATSRELYTEPAGATHFAGTEDQPAVVDITGIGPSDTIYVDAADSRAARAPRH